MENPYQSPNTSGGGTLSKTLESVALGCCWVLIAVGVLYNLLLLSPLRDYAMKAPEWTIFAWLALVFEFLAVYALSGNEPAGEDGV